MARREFIPITFEGGANLSDINPIGVPPGELVDLINWIPEPAGYLRQRGNYYRTPPTGTAAPTGGDGIYWSPLASPTGGVFVSRYSAGTLSIFRATSDTDPNFGSAAIDTVTTTAGYVPFVTANNIVLYGNRSFPGDKLRFWNGTAAADASTVAIAGRTLAYYAERFWSAGTDANPTRLYYSGVADHTSWDLLNYIAVGQNDGGAIVAVEPALGGMLIAKENGIFFLTGAGPATFAVTRLDGYGEGVDGRCILPTPRGVMIAGQRSLYLWEGGTAVERLLTGSSINILGGNLSWVSSAFQDQRAYFVDSLQGLIFVRDMRSGAFHRESVDSNGNNMIRHIAIGGQDVNVILGIASGSTATETGFRTRPVAASDQRDNNSVAMNLVARTGIIPIGMGVRPVTVKHLHVLGYQYDNGFGGTNQAGLRMDVDVFRGNGGSDTRTKTWAPNTLSGVRRDRMDVGLPGYECQVAFQQTLTSTDNVSFHIRSAVLELDVEEPR